MSIFEAHFTVVESEFLVYQLANNEQALCNCAILAFSLIAVAMKMFSASISVVFNHNLVKFFSFVICFSFGRSDVFIRVICTVKFNYTSRYPFSVIFLFSYYHFLY